MPYNDNDAAGDGLLLEAMPPRGNGAGSFALPKAAAEDEQNGESPGIAARGCGNCMILVGGYLVLKNHGETADSLMVVGSLIAVGWLDVMVSKGIRLESYLFVGNHSESWFALVIWLVCTDYT